MSDAPHDISRSLPQATDAEKGILSCFFHNPEKLLSDARNTLPMECFYHPGNRLLYEVMLEFYEDERPVDYIAIGQHLTDKGLMSKIGGIGVLSEILEFVPIPTHYNYYKGILKDKYLLRRIINACTESIQDAYENPEQPGVLLETVTDRIYAIAKQEQGEHHKQFHEILDTYEAEWTARMKNEKEAGIPTRWRSFNRTFGGITPRYWLVTAYPSEGKSSLVQNMAEDALAHGVEVLWFSFEMDEIEHTDRLVTAKTRLNSQRIFFPQNGVDRTDMQQISNALADMRQWGLHLRCEDWTAEQIFAEARAMCLKHKKIGLIAVDYLQLLNSSKKFDKRSDEINYISRNFKRLSRNLNLPVVVLSQLNDDGKTLDGRAPNQDASNILYIQPAFEGFNVKTKKRESTPAGLRVVKNRNGKKGHLLPIRLNGATFTFEEEGNDGPDLPLQNGPDWD